MSCALFDWREKGGNLSVETEFMTSSIQRKEGLSISMLSDVTKRESYLFYQCITPDFHKHEDTLEQGSNAPHIMHFHFKNLKTFHPLDSLQSVLDLDE
jgi:hypothetical protein